MPIQLPNFLNAPLYEPDYSGVVNAIPRAFETYKQGLESSETPYELRHNRMMNAEKLKAAAFENALNEEFGKREKLADILQKEAHAKFWEQGGRGGGGASSPKERRILLNAMGPDGKAELFRLGSILGWDHTKTMDNYLNGITPQMAAAEEGIDLSQETGHILPTGKNRSDLINAEGVESEIEGINKYIGDDLAYFGRFGGLNEKWDSILGTNKEARLRGLGARAVQPELASVRSRLAQGSNALEALHGMQRDALAKIDILEPGITGEDRVFVQNYVNEAIKAGFNERKKGVLGGHKKTKVPSSPKISGKKDFSVQPYTVDDPRVLSTAKKYNMTPEQVVEKLNKAQP
jgi:hypothetical protein